MCYFSEKVQKIFKRTKKNKIFENLGKNVQNLKMCWLLHPIITHNKLLEKALIYNLNNVLLLANKENSKACLIYSVETIRTQHEKTELHKIINAGPFR